jgi:hypothetical protein
MAGSLAAKKCVPGPLDTTDTDGDGVKDVYVEIDGVA